MNKHEFNTKKEILLDDVESLLTDNCHLDNPQRFIELIDKVSIYWTLLSEEERDFLHGAMFVVTEGIPWESKDE